jgi:uncharacterized membrane protein YbhN (UPF0104 family)
MSSSLQQIRSRLGLRGLAATAAVLLALVVAVATPQLLGTRVAAAFAALGNADAKWLWLAGIGFAVSVVSAAGSWRCAIRLCGGTLTLPDACARYGAGSLVNTFVPARAGDAVRIGLFSRVLPNRERLWTTGCAFADVDGDGDLDLVLLATKGPNAIFLSTVTAASPSIAISGSIRQERAARR